MPCPIRFRCPGCRARLKAPVRLLGRPCSCPGCYRDLSVRPEPPEDAGPRLVIDSGLPSVWHSRRWPA
jgi:hypothetical protein